MIAAARRRGPVDLALGTRRARAAAALELALPGTVYLYQGEELGLPEAFDLPDDARQDPIWIRSEGAELGRDGSRVPMPWTAGTPSLGFSAGAEPAPPWLPQPTVFSELAVDRQDGEPDSMLELYRRLIRLRPEIFTGDDLEWMPTGSADALAFRRGRGVCLVNFGAADLELPSGWAGEIVAASAPTDARRVGADCAVWLVLDRDPATVVDPADGVREDSPSPQRESLAA
jgi:alpha-glucosidase